MVTQQVMDPVSLTQRAPKSFEFFLYYRDGRFLRLQFSFNTEEDVNGFNGGWRKGLDELLTNVPDTLRIDFPRDTRIDFSLQRPLSMEYSKSKDCGLLYLDGSYRRHVRYDLNQKT